MTNVLTRAARAALSGIRCAVAASAFAPRERRAVETYLMVTACNLEGATVAEVLGCSKQNVSKLCRAVEDRRERADYDRALSALENVFSNRGETEMARRWRCFHCDEVFTMHSTARAHFGSHEALQPMCQVDPEEFRRMERELERYRDEDSDKDRQMAAMAADHRQSLIREEEAGYAKGVADMKPSVNVLRNALRAMVGHYVAQISSGDCGCWNPEEEDVVKHSRFVLRSTEEFAEPAQPQGQAPVGDVSPPRCVFELRRDDVKPQFSQRSIGGGQTYSLPSIMPALKLPRRRASSR